MAETTDPLQAIIGQSIDEAMAVPSIRAMVEKEAARYFMEQYGVLVIGGSVLALGLAFGAGRWSKEAGYES